MKWKIDKRIDCDSARLAYLGLVFFFFYFSVFGQTIILASITRFGCHLNDPSPLQKHTNIKDPNISHFA